MKWRKRIVTGIIIVLLLVAFTIIYNKSKPVVEVYTDINQYQDYLANKKSTSKWYKWGMDESIWPKEITSNMDVIDYKMVYYDPWDAQYLGYLVVDYSESDYQKERARLINYKSTKYIGYYSVQSEDTYILLAVKADPYYGFVYALTDGKNRIIYAEQIFCNYFMDLDYKKYMKEEYFLDGFDATENNPYKLEKTKGEQ